MSKKKKKSGKKDVTLPTAKIVLITAILELIDKLIDLISLLNE